MKLANGSIVRVVLSPGKVELEFFFALKRTTGKTRKMKRQDNSDVEALFYEVFNRASLGFGVPKTTEISSSSSSSNSAAAIQQQQQQKQPEKTKLKR